MDSSVECRVVSWNIHACVGSDGHYDVNRVADVLADLDADIIGLQEVDWRRAAPDGREAFQAIADQLDMASVEGPNLSDPNGRYGNGLLTRFNVATVQNLKLAYKSREPRGAIDAVLHAGDTRIRTLVTHLGLTYRERRFQVSALREALEAGEAADVSILMGDMNEWISRRLMARAFTPTPFATMITGRTFPSRWPIFPLDCIFVGPKPATCVGRIVRIRSARLASDHLPVVADLSWEP